MKIFFKILLIYIFPFKYYYSQIITIPFKRILSPVINETNFYSNYVENKIYTTIDIGTPSTKIQAQIKMEQYSLCIRKDSIYKYNSSSSYEKNEEEFTYKGYNSDYEKAIPSNESFILGSKNDKLFDFKFLLTTYSRYDMDAIIGLQMKEKEQKTIGYNLVPQLKRKGLISKEVFFFNFNENKDDGELIIGQYPHLLDNFKEIYFEEQLETTGAYIQNENIYYHLIFRSVFWNGTEINNMIKIKLNIETGYIIGPKIFEQFSNEFFLPHIKKKKCVKNYVNRIYTAFICDDYPDLNIESFPELIFYNSDMNYSFILTYKDLFMKKGNKIYYMVVFDGIGNYYQWTIGNIFIKNIMMVFDMDKKIIGIYDTSKKKEKIGKEKNNIINVTIYIVVIAITCGIIVALVIFIIYKFFWKKKSKKAYELKEDYEYTTAINE